MTILICIDKCVLVRQSSVLNNWTSLPYPRSLLQKAWISNTPGVHQHCTLCPMTSACKAYQMIYSSRENKIISSFNNIILFGKGRLKRLVYSKYDYSKSNDYKDVQPNLTVIGRLFDEEIEMSWPQCLEIRMSRIFQYFFQ